MRHLRNFGQWVLRSWNSWSVTQRIAYVALGIIWLWLFIHILDVGDPWSDKINERWIAHKSFLVKNWVALGLYWASVINLVVVSFLLLTVRIWTKTNGSPAEQAETRSKTSKWFPLLVVGAMAVSFILCLPRLSLSFWGDEEYSYRTNIFGQYERDDDTGEIELERVTLQENLWNYKNPNNHFLFTLLARASHEIWSSFASNPDYAFSEVSARTPSLIAGLLAIAALAYLLKSFGYPRAGIIAAWFMAIHPWHMKYASEARGYALVLLSCSLGIILLRTALLTTRWKWWLLYALVQFCMLYAYPAALYLLVTQNLAAVLIILFLSKQKQKLASRWFVANTISAMLAIQLLAPVIPQIKLWLARDRAKAELGFEWIRDFWGYLTTGMSWTPWDPNNPLCHTVIELQDSNPFGFGFIAYLIPILLIIGFIRLMASGKWNALFGVALVAAAPLAYWHTQSNGNILYVWYLIYALPVYAALTALALDGIGKIISLKTPKWQTTSATILAVFFLATFWQITNAQRVTLRNHAVEPQRQSALAMRPGIAPETPGNDDILSVQFCFTIPLYDPLHYRIRDDEDTHELLALMLRANQEDKELFVNFGSEGLARYAFPELMAILDNPKYFEPITKIWGLELQNTRLVYKYISGSYSS